MKRIRLLAVVLANVVIIFRKQVAKVDFESFGNAIQRLEGRVHPAVFYAGNLVWMDVGHEPELAQAHPRPLSVAEDVEAEFVSCTRRM